jgi:hypothetical protein
MFENCWWELLCFFFRCTRSCICTIMCRGAYYSKTLNKAERNYCVTRRKLLVIVRTLEQFHKYLYGQDFHRRTDHSPLTWLMRFKNLERQIARRVQRLFSNIVKARNKKCRCCLKTALRRRIYALSQSRVTGRHKESTSYFSPTRSRLGSAGSENGTAKRHRHRAHSVGSTNRTTTGVERYRRPESHIQNLLGPVEMARCKKRRTRAQLGIRQRTIQISPNSSPSEQSGGRAHRTARWTVRRSPGFQ